VRDRRRSLQGSARRLWLRQELHRALVPAAGTRARFAVAEVQISENDTPLHRLETVYRRATEGCAHRSGTRARSARSSPVANGP